MKVLVLISELPEPPTSGHRVRNHYLWPQFSHLGVELKVLGLSNARANVQNGEKTEPGDDREFYPFDRPILPLRVLGRISKSYIEWPRSQKLTDRVIELCKSWQPDVIHAEHLRMATYFPSTCPKTVLKTVSFHNVESELNRKIGSSTLKFGRPLVNWLHLQSLIKFEKHVVDTCDLNFAYSAVDLEKYRELFPNANWSITRNGTNAKEITPGPQVAEKNILIVGSLNYQPNVTGLFWFIEKVLPQLPPDISITVAGSGITSGLRDKISQTRIKFIDTPLKLEPFYRDCALCVVPVFDGSGTRGKILEALAYDRMVITTKLGAEGLEISEGIIFAEDATQFIKEIKKWSGDLQKREAFSGAGRKQVLERYDWSVVAAGLKSEWELLISKLIPGGLA